MKYIIFTDAACNNEEKLLGTGYIIKTYTKFIKVGAKVFEGRKASRGELFAIAVALEDLSKQVKLKPYDEITIYSDCRSAIKLITELDSINIKDKYNGDKIMMVALTIISKFKSAYSIELRECKGHHSYVNDNKVVDALAKYALRSAIVKRGGI